MKIHLIKTLPDEGKAIYYAGQKDGTVIYTENPANSILFTTIKQAHDFVKKSLIYWTIKID